MQKTKNVGTFDCTIYVPDNGYEWSCSENSAEPILFKRKGTEREIPYSPLESDPPMYITFANLYNTPRSQIREEILQFAGKYGWLGLNTEAGEGLYTWSKAINGVWRLIQVWNWLQDKKVEELRKCIEWSPARQQVAFIFNAGFLEEKTNRDENGTLWNEDLKGLRFIDRQNFLRKDYARLFDLWHEDELKYLTRKKRRGPIFGPTELYIASLMNRNLSDLVSPSMAFDTEGKLIKSFNVSNLFGAVWIGLYQALLNPRGIVQCSVCTEWMDVTKNRSSKKVHPKCGQRRRKDRYNKRQKK